MNLPYIEVDLRGLGNAVWTVDQAYHLGIEYESFHLIGQFHVEQEDECTYDHHEDAFRERDIE